jgi:RNA polymerase primary sigma factor
MTDGEEKNKLIKVNSKLVFSIAKEYIDQGLHLFDLLYIGNIALIKAVENFDFQTESEFSAFAASCIRQKITHSISESEKGIRVPIHIIKQVEKLNRESQQLKQSLGREPTDDEIAEYLGWTINRVGSVKKTAKEFILIGNEEETNDRIGHEAYIMLKEQIDNILTALPEKEKEKLNIRYGLNDGYLLTFEEKQ